MFGFFKKNKPKNPQDNTSSKTQKTSLLKKFKQGLQKTRQQFSSGLAKLFSGKAIIDESLIEEIETQLLLADVGIEATETILKNLKASLKGKNEVEGAELRSILKSQLVQLLENTDSPTEFPASKTTRVILMVGINGAGKTTTIGKLSHHFKASGHSVMLAAGDTFRAGAIDQLKVWGERNQVPVIAQQPGSDSASVLFDAIQSANSKEIDVLIADTAGRLHTQTNLMEELKKVIRVIKKQDETAPHEVILVLDAGTGQNALIQAEQFLKATNVTGLILTKLDGTAKGGIVFALKQKINRPILFLGVGEGIDDLKPFDAQTFVDALLSVEENTD